jgi:hypothetical protein
MSKNQQFITKDRTIRIFGCGTAIANSSSAAFMAEKHDLEAKCVIK